MAGPEAPDAHADRRSRAPVVFMLGQILTNLEKLSTMLHRHILMEDAQLAKVEASLHELRLHQISIEARLKKEQPNGR